jgi:phospholipid/cholesterol/gamma-HCH transport system substrate-binding protein
MTAPDRGRRAGVRMKTASLAAGAALLLSGCEFSVYDIPLPGGADVGDDPYNITAEFRDVLDLVPQSSVMVDDVTVGRVKDITLRGHVARVDMVLHDDVELPANARAEIRQTSLLGEKFVSLEQPGQEPSSRKLEDGDVIPLARSGRNIEVEEVLGALSLLLNGGGVGQLKSITQETNTILDGRTGTVKSVLREMRTFMAQLDGSKFEILRALENLNELSKSLNANTETLDLALDELPSAIKSIDSQRADLVKMLEALAELSGVGTRVIRASKQGTIESLNALAPILRELHRAGDAFPRSLQLALTFPFADAVVGKTPQAARDLQMGDWTNLSIDMQVDPRDLAVFLADEIDKGTGSDAASQLVGQLCEQVSTLPICSSNGGDGGSPGGPSGPGDVLPDDGPGPGLPGPGLPGGAGLGRAATGESAVSVGDVTAAAARAGVDLELTGLLAGGVLSR